jgi:cellulose synthase/poly-beta-1,6-N-acetylglucosamine synthase-like glycosyltransferase
MGWVIGICFVFVVYAYVGYPALLWLLAKFKRHQPEPAVPESDWPTVTVIIAAHNEENNIVGRLENVLGADYPPEKLSVVVACDGCTDRTALLASRYERVQVVEVFPHRGKASSLNEAVKRATGDVLVFADARQRFARDAIRWLVAALCHNGVGAAGGDLILVDFAGAPQAMGAYWRYEKLVRGLEARVDSPIQCSGAIYAIYRRLFVPMPEGLVLDDMWVPLHIRRQGYRIALASEAKAYDTVTPSYDREFKRKVRTLAGNYQLMWAAPWLLVPFMNPLWWQFVSHKVCRLLVPYALITMYGASWALLGKPYGAALVVAQTGYYLLGAVAWSVPRAGATVPLGGAGGLVPEPQRGSGGGPVRVCAGQGAGALGSLAHDVAADHDGRRDRR